MPEMNDNQRLQLQEMIKANNVEDQTEIIRQLKHSSILRENIKKDNCSYTITLWFVGRNLYKLSEKF